MTQNEFILIISEKTGVDRETTQTIISAMTETITESVKNDECVQLWGLGKFERRTYKPRKCYNPIKDKVVTIAGSYVPVFKAGTKFKKMLIMMIDCNKSF